MGNPGTINPVIFTNREKCILLAIKSGYAIAWGFINTVIYLLAERFATIMTGNLLLLAIEAKDWRVDEMLFTLFLILAYICSGAAYDLVSILFLNDQNRVVRILIPVVILLGVLADTLEYLSEGCSTKESCSGNDLYFLLPISSMTGLVASGYCSAHPDGIITTMVTGHMRIPPNAILKILLTEGPDRELLKEKAWTSVVIVTSFFGGAITGAYTRDRILMTYGQRRFSPVFTCFGSVMAALCFLHHNCCKRFWNLHGANPAIELRKAGFPALLFGSLDRTSENDIANEEPNGSTIGAHHTVHDEQPMTQDVDEGWNSRIGRNEMEEPQQPNERSPTKLETVN